MAVCVLLLVHVVTVVCKVSALWLCVLLLVHVVTCVCAVTLSV